MIHTRDGEEAIEVIDIQVSIRAEELVNGLVVVNCVARADELVRPSEVLDQLSIMLGSYECSDVRVDRLGRTNASEEASRDIRGTHISLSGIQLVGEG